MSGQARPFLQHSLRQGAVYGELSLSLVAVPGPRNSLILSLSQSLANCVVLLSTGEFREQCCCSVYWVQFYARAFVELEIRYALQRQYRGEWERSNCVVDMRRPEKPAVYRRYVHME